MAETAPKSDRRRYAGFEDVTVPVVVRVGRARCTLAALSELAEGEVIRLDAQVGVPFDLFAGDVLLGHVEPVARGEGVAVKLVAVAEADDDATD